MYQIFVDTFCCKDPPESVKEKLVSWDVFPKWKPDEDGEYRNNQYYGGNFKGIISKLPYLKSLNVTVIYLTPVFKGDSSNRYDIIDYDEIDEMIGTWDELKELKETANSMGIKLILDVVFNHASSKNPLIKENPELFYWKKKYTDPVCWWDYPNLVKFNQENLDYRIFLKQRIFKYVGYSDGIRIDVADELTDSSLKLVRNLIYECVSEIYKELTVEFYILGEVWKNAIIGDYRSFFYGDELDGVMNYQFTNAIYRYVRWKKADYLRTILNNIIRLYPPEALDVSPVFLSSHDIPRPLNILVGDFMREDSKFENVWSMEEDGFWLENGKFNTYKFRKWEAEHDQISDEKLVLGKKLLKVAVFLQYTLPGLPAIFAGDEFGMTGYKDPFNRKPLQWNNMDQDILDFYIKMGSFRMSYRAEFSDSSNFELKELTEERFVYKRGNLKFTINLKDLNFKVE